MSYQSESELEQQLMKHMQMKHSYEYVNIKDMDELEGNFRIQINKLNKQNLNNQPLTDKEFERILIYCV